MKVLLIGSGGREHALAWKLAQSPRLDRLYCAPGNAGTAEIAENVSLDPMQLEEVVEWAVEHSIDLVVVGPEAPLAAGLADRVREAGIPVFGPSANAAHIESSKVWSKAFCQRHGIPTAQAEATERYEDALRILERTGLPAVIKADGLAAGKGVTVVDDWTIAAGILRAYLVDGQLGQAGRRVLIEQQLEGPELTLLAFTDGERLAPIPPARDYKRVGTGDQGPNTGGMGAYAPVPEVDSQAARSLTQQFLEPAVRGLAAEGRPFQGVLYAGLMLTADGPRLIEFNCRSGDPETQVIIPLLETDLLNIAEAIARGAFDPASVHWSRGAACSVVLAAEGYPGPIRTGDRIEGLDRVLEDVLVFHAGTRLDDAGIAVTAGGRALNVVGTGATLMEARDAAYRGVSAIQFDGMHYRSDIALAAVQGIHSQPEFISLESGFSGKWVVPQSGIDHA